MSELRKDPLVGRWVIISTERARRPDEFLPISAPSEATQPDCPFCQGNEGETSPEIFSDRAQGSAPNTPGWNIRVVPSISPVLRVEGQLERKARGLYDVITGIGAHEIIVETPTHVASLAQLPHEQIRRVIDTYIQRMIDLERDERFKYVLLFKNCGRVAGEGRFRHSRSQLIALPVNPIRLKEELHGAQQYYELKERCLFCDVIRQELDAQKRIAAETTHFVAVTPFASRFPFEIWILPKGHSPDFNHLGLEQRSDLARILKAVLSKLSRVLDHPPYNAILHTAPFRRRKAGYWRSIDQDFHWHLEIMPRLTRVAGFEWGSGFYINPTSPEEAARFLRDVELPAEA